MHIQVLAFFFLIHTRHLFNTIPSTLSRTTQLADWSWSSITFIYFIQPLAHLQQLCFSSCPANIKDLFWSKHTHNHQDTKCWLVKLPKVFSQTRAFSWSYYWSINYNKRHWKYPYHRIQVCYVLPLRSGERLEEKTRHATQKILLAPGKCPGGKWTVHSFSRKNFLLPPATPPSTSNTPSTGPTHKD